MRGEREPGISKVQLIAAELNIYLYWLIVGHGPTKYLNQQSRIKKIADTIVPYVTDDKEEIIHKFKRLKNRDRKIVIDLINSLLNK